jgi:hypothetical protein
MTDDVDGDVTAALLVVHTNPKEGRDDEYNRWYDEDHVNDVLGVPGVAAVQRYSLSRVDLPGSDAPVQLPVSAHRYLAVYEVDRDPNEVVTAFLTAVGNGDMPLSDALDVDTISLTAWQPHGERRIRPT